MFLHSYRCSHGALFPWKTPKTYSEKKDGISILNPTIYKTNFKRLHHPMDHDC